jgi:hypothetical protein
MIDYLRHQGYIWNHQGIYRVYCEMGLNLRRREALWDVENPERQGFNVQGHSGAPRRERKPS